MAAFPLTESILIGVFVQSVLLGFHTIAFGFSLRYMLWDSKRVLKKEGVNRIIVSTACVIWLLATLNVALNLVTDVKAFVYYTGPGGPAAALSIRDTLGNIRTTMHLIMMTLGDTIMIYRCWIVYGRSWLIIVLPFLLLLGELGCGLAVVIIVWVTPPQVALVNVGRTLRSVTLGNWACTCALTLLATILIATRIWIVDRSTKRVASSVTRVGGSPLLYAVRIIVESGLLYAMTILISLILFATGSTAAYILTSAMPQVIGIAFNLIIVRASTHSEKEYTFSTSEPPTFALHIRRSRGDTDGAISASDMFEDETSRAGFSEGKVPDRLPDLEDGGSITVGPR